MNETKISADQIVAMTLKELYIRIRINKAGIDLNGDTVYVTEVMLSSSKKIKKDWSFIVYRCSYYNVKKENEFKVETWSSVYTKDEFYAYLNRMFLHPSFDFPWEKEMWTLVPQSQAAVIRSKTTIGHGDEEYELKNVPISNPEVLIALARMEGILRTQQKLLDTISLELHKLVCHRLSALISQQLKKWSQMVG